MLILNPKCVDAHKAYPCQFIPLRYGKRPIYLLTTFIGFASALGCAYTKTYGELIGARVVNGIFPVA